MSGAETARRRVVQRRIGGAEMALKKTIYSNQSLQSRKMNAVPKECSYYHCRNKFGNFAYSNNTSTFTHFRIYLVDG